MSSSITHGSVTHGSVTRGSATRWLVLATLVVLGLFGSSIDRAVVATPAWAHLGALDWAAYSRHADLGTGLILYPIIGILPTVLAVVAAITHRLDRGRPRSASRPIYLAALAMSGVMATTVIAAPVMLNVGNLGNDQNLLRHAFDQFTLWGVQVRGGFFAVAFLATVWAFARLARRPARLDDCQDEAAGSV